MKVVRLLTVTHPPGKQMKGDAISGKQVKNLISWGGKILLLRKHLLVFSVGSMRLFAFSSISNPLDFSPC